MNTLHAFSVFPCFEESSNNAENSPLLTNDAVTTLLNPNHPSRLSVVTTLSKSQPAHVTSSALCGTFGASPTPCSPAHDWTGGTAIEVTACEPASNILALSVSSPLDFEGVEALKERQLLGHDQEAISTIIEESEASFLRAALIASVLSNMLILVSETTSFDRYWSELLTRLEEVRQMLNPSLNRFMKNQLKGPLRSALPGLPKNVNRDRPTTTWGGSGLLVGAVSWSEKTTTHRGNMTRNILSDISGLGITCANPFLYVASPDDPEPISHLRDLVLSQKDHSKPVCSSGPWPGAVVLLNIWAKQEFSNILDACKQVIKTSIERRVSATAATEVQIPQPTQPKTQLENDSLKTRNWMPRTDSRQRANQRQPSRYEQSSRQVAPGQVPQGPRQLYVVPSQPSHQDNWGEGRGRRRIQR